MSQFEVRNVVKDGVLVPALTALRPIATEAQLEQARAEYENDDVGIDDDAAISEIDPADGQGVWIQAWLYLGNEEDES